LSSETLLAIDERRVNPVPALPDPWNSPPAKISSFAKLVVDNPVPPGSILLTGTGLVPPDDFTLLPGHFVEIHVPEIGTLVNPVVRASELIEKEYER